ncbi:putative disease resistance protein RGA1 [Pistacia vera]|uniref:putative disease resistance protein RGA1 n=1 Tax=Pistacia vera TaxID=55513 RepID=UPI001262C52C|nr:putative disease resistance protein RGA1 [Pistacia vera]
MAKTGVEYLLQKLSNYHCLYIFAHHSLGTNDIGVHDQELKEIGEKMVKRCDGLPLVAKALGGLWHGKYDINDWRDVLNSKIWNLSKEECDVMSALKIRLSFFSIVLFSGKDIMSIIGEAVLSATTEMLIEKLVSEKMTSRLVRIWLGEQQNLAYDVEDILDEFATESLRSKLLLESQPQATTSKGR